MKIFLLIKEDALYMFKEENNTIENLLYKGEETYSINSTDYFESIVHLKDYLLSVYNETNIQAFQIKIIYHKIEKDLIEVLLDIFKFSNFLEIQRFKTILNHVVTDLYSDKIEKNIKIFCLGDTWKIELKNNRIKLVESNGSAKYNIPLIEIPKFYIKEKSLLKTGKSIEEYKDKVIEKDVVISRLKERIQSLEEMNNQQKLGLEKISKVISLTKKRKEAYEKNRELIFIIKKEEDIKTIRKLGKHGKVHKIDKINLKEHNIKVGYSFFSDNSIKFINIKYNKSDLDNRKTFGMNPSQIGLILGNQSTLTDTGDEKIILKNDKSVLPIDVHEIKNEYDETVALVIGALYHPKDNLDLVRSWTNDKIDSIVESISEVGV